MEFEAVYKKFYLHIIRLVRKAGNYAGLLNEEDMIQEMSIHLWHGYKDGKFQDKTDSYVIQSLWFCLKNCRRKKMNRKLSVSLDEPVTDEGLTLKDIVPDPSPLFTETLENEMFIEKIRNNGLTKREKEVFNYCLQGYNLREIGRKLGISHVGVFKIRESMRRKIRLEYEK